MASLHPLNPLEKDVIRSIIAENEEQEPPQNDAVHFMQAFAGGFSSLMPFTLFMPVSTKVILYVSEKGANESADKRSEFNKRCETLKKPLLDTANFIIDLAEHDYLRLIKKQSKVELPQNYGAHWRRYEAFYMSELESLIVVCSNLLIPKLKLYKLAKLDEEKSRLIIKTR
ncbi:MAG: hypothetical protein LBT14_01985 [Treponema sp.]|jgi:hypothetical protein|nr:hypothetical protein [Treponema sp.]